MEEIKKLPDPKTPLKINVRFAWKSCTPDARQWKPSMPVLEPMDIQVVVEVPLNIEYILNREDLLTWQIGSGNGKMPEIKLTPLGMRFCIDALEQSMSPQAVHQVKEEGETTNEDDFDDWDTEEPVKETKPKTKKKIETKKVKSLAEEVLPADEWKSYRETEPDDFDEDEKPAKDEPESDFDFDN